MKKFILLLNVVLTLSLLVGGCAAPTPEVIEKEVIVEKEVPVTVVVEKEVVVEKPVVETVVVEKEVVVEKPVEVVKKVVVTPPPTEEPVDLTDWEWDFTPEPDATLTIALSVDPWVEYSGNLDPHQANWDEAVWMLEQCLSAPFYDTGIDILPDAALHWETNETYTEYTIYFNPKRTWSDGETVVAGDFRAGMLRTLSPDVESPNASLLFGIEGGRAYHGGQLGAEYVGIEALNEATLRIWLEEPDSNFIRVLTTATVWPARGDFSYETVVAGALSSLPCNGYYVFDEYIPGESMTMTRLDNQLGADQVTVRQAHFLFVGDEGARLSAFENGELDIAWLNDYYQPDGLEDFPWVAYNLQAEPYKVLHSLFFNMRSGWCADPTVRRALAMVTPPDVGDQAYGAGTVFTAYSLVPEIPGPSIAFDPESARHLLYEAGYDGQALTILASNHSQQWLDMLAEIAAVWDILLGVKAEVAALPWDNYLSTARQCASAPDDCPFDIVLRSVWPRALQDPRDDAMLRLLASDRLDPLALGWVNNQFDELLVRARASEPGDERIALLEQAQEVLLSEDPALIPLFYVPGYYAWNPDLFHIPITVPEDPASPKRMVPIKDLGKLKDLQLDDWHRLALRLLEARRYYMDLQTAAYADVARAAIGKLETWAATVEYKWKPNADLAADVVDLVSIWKGGTTRKVVKTATFLYKQMSEGMQDELRGDLEKALGKLSGALQTKKGSIGSIVQQSYDRNQEEEDQGKESLASLYNQGDKHGIITMTKKLRHEFRGATVWQTRYTNGQVDWSITRPGVTPPDYQQIMGEFLITLHDMRYNQADLWLRQGPPPHWESAGCEPIATKLNGIEYFRDTRVPFRCWPARWRTSIVQRFADNESGIKMIEINWAKSSNVGRLYWRDFGYISWTKYMLPRDGIMPIYAIAGKTSRYGTSMWLNVHRENPKIPVILHIRVVDGSGNKSSFIIKH